MVNMSVKDRIVNGINKFKEETDKEPTDLFMGFYELNELVQEQKKIYGLPIPGEFRGLKIHSMGSTADSGIYLAVKVE